MPETLKTRLPVAIIAFKRAGSLRRIIHTSLEVDSPKIYIYLDGPRNAEDIEEVEATRNVALEFLRSHPEVVTVFMRTKNVGAATAVLTSVNHFFSQFDSGIILEDDCIPSAGFFEFAIWAVSVMKLNPTIVLAGGFLPLPKELLIGRPILTKYIQIWGWVCTSENWFQVTNQIARYSNTKLLSLSPNKSFWAAGNRRANRGFTDAWDTPLSFVIQQNDLKCILPNENLISNIGDDLAATHTKQSPWLHSETGSFIPCDVEELITNQAIEDWLRKTYFGIRLRHIVTTRVTYLLDFFRHAPRPNLQERISANEI